MKKIIIVNNNMKVGGVQKSLINLLRSIEGKAEITLLLFSQRGEYIDYLPTSVRIFHCNSLFRYLGMSQGECKGLDRFLRGFLAALCKLLGRATVMKLLLASQNEVEEEFDCAISFLHNGRDSNFYGGTQEFVLHKVRAKQKVAFLHCDYSQSGANTKANNALIEQFDWIAACSEGCRNAFIQTLPELEERCVCVRNCHDYPQILKMAEMEKIAYPVQTRNVVMVSRLAHEKGIERAIEATAYALKQGIQIHLHIVGGGPMEQQLRQKVQLLDLGKNVHFYGEKANPYPYMYAADLFLLTSFHEAAPMVIEEASALGTPILTVRTTSSNEMVVKRNCGWVCDNGQQALNEALVRVLRNSAEVDALKQAMLSRTFDNSEAMAQFMNLIEG